MPGEVTLSVVVPAYDEAEALPLFVARLRPVLDGLEASYEVLVVDDGSTDDTPVLLARYQREWPQLRVVRLRANSGHQAALSAGFARAVGAWLVSIDADLQDPPETIATMLRTALDEKVDVVYGTRMDRSSDTAFKRTTAKAFYWLMQRIVRRKGQAFDGDFRLVSRAVVDAVNSLPEHNRVLRLVIPALGFPSTQVGYVRDSRVAGRSKYPFARMVRLSVDSITGFSIAPLRLATWFGLLGGTGAALTAVAAIIANLAGKALPGWTSTFVLVAGVGAVQLLCIGILGEYIGRMYTQMQGRPSYFVAYDSLEHGAPTANGSSAGRAQLPDGDRREAQSPVG